MVFEYTNLDNFHYKTLICIKKPLARQQSTIKLILTNPIYTGNIVKSRTEMISLRTNQRQETPFEQQTIFHHTHPALISMDEFHEVQRKLKTKGTSK